MLRLDSIVVLLVLIASLTSCLADEESKRDEKLISTFQIVRFPNDPCVGSNTRNGTCYTSQECSDKSGTSAGSCADGFGVCCTFIISTCGKTTSENLTAWTQDTTIASTGGTCSLKVCPIDDSICSIRLDFTTFVITGPSTDSLARVRRRFGHPTMELADAYAIQGSAQTTSCLTDVFYMRGASPSSTPPSVCATMTGHHMYMEADVDNCNDLTFHLADAATTTAQAITNKGITTLATRTWDITITQIECTSAVNPPVGCTKYFYNAAGRAQITSHNWQVTTTSIHLGQQHERYCIRRERGMCVGCFATVDSGFQISGRSGSNVHYTLPGGCCGYATQTAFGDAMAANYETDGNGLGGAVAATTGLTQTGWDCIIIPGAFLNSNNGDVNSIASQTSAVIQQVITAANTDINTGSGPQICGQGAGIGGGVENIRTEMWVGIKANLQATAEGVNENRTVCTRSTPFILEFMSDDLDGLGGAAGAAENTEISTAGAAGSNLGFTLTHTQLSC